MPINFTTSAATVGELFAEAKIYRMPEFQRPYSWGDDEALQLFEDLQAAYVDGNAVDAGEYFLGTLIVKRDGQFNCCVVDGQQRLVTLTAILAVIRDQYDTTYRADLQNSIVRQADQTRRLEETSRVQLRHLDHNHFLEWVITEGGTKNLPDHAPTESTTKLLAVLKRLKLEVEQTRGDFWKGFATFILNECSLVVVSTDTLDMAYKLFKSVNNVGVGLNAMAIARAELLGREFDNARLCHEIAKAWDEIEIKLGIDNLQNYVMTVASLVLADNVQREPFEAIRAIVRNAELSVAFSVKLREFLLAYLALDTATINFGPDTARINRLVTCLLNAPFNEWRPAALFWLTQGRSAPESEAFFRALDGLCLSLTILGVKSAAKLTQRFQSIIAAIASGSALSRTTSPLYLTNAERNTIRERITGPIKRKEKYLPYLLARLNAEVTAPEFDLPFPEKVEVEHVLPQSPSNAWLANFPNDGEREKLTHMLGNLTLLTPRKNKQIGNKSFETKKEKIFGLSENNCFALTSNVAAYSDWTPDIIRRRHDELIRHAANIMAL